MLLQERHLANVICCRRDAASGRRGRSRCQEVVWLVMWRPGLRLGAFAIIRSGGGGRTGRNGCEMDRFWFVGVRAAPGSKRTRCGGTLLVGNVGRPQRVTGRPRGNGPAGPSCPDTHPSNSAGREKSIRLRARRSGCRRDDRHAAPGCCRSCVRRRVPTTGSDQDAKRILGQWGVTPFVLSGNRKGPPSGSGA